MPKIISIANIKGGSGKSTTAIHLALALRQFGSVLAVDLDCQADLTEFFFPGMEPEFFDEANTYTLLRSQTQLKESIKTAHNLDVLPAVLELSELSFQAVRNLSIIHRLKTVLEKSKYDYIVIDTPGSFSVELTTSFLAADTVVIPVTPIPWSIRAVSLVLKGIEEAKSSGSSRVKKILVLPTSFGKSQRDNKLLEKFKSISWITLLSAIPKNNSIQERTGQSLALQEGSEGWEAFQKLAKEIK